MMINDAYFALAVLAVTAIWFIWDLGIKKFILDAFRERLFELRFRLYSLGARGDIDFDDEAYRAVETLICGLLRFAHRLTFVGFLLSSIQQKEARASKDYVDFHQQLKLKVARTKPAAQNELNAVLSGVSQAVALYTSFTSLFFMACVPVVAFLHSINMLRSFTKTQVSSVLESEAYREESRKPVIREAVTA